MTIIYTRKLFIGITIAAVGSLAVAGMTAAYSANHKTANGVGNSQAPVSQRERRRSMAESELVTITPRGFEPGEIRRSSGKFVLVFENRSGLQLTEPRLVREVGDTIREIRLSREEPDWTEEVDLPPGRYVLKEAGHSEWICPITITE